MAAGRGRGWSTLAEVAEAAGCSKATVQRAWRELEPEPAMAGHFRRAGAQGRVELDQAGAALVAHAAGRRAAGDGPADGPQGAQEPAEAPKPAPRARKSGKPGDGRQDGSRAAVEALADEVRDLRRRLDESQARVAELEAEVRGLNAELVEAERRRADDLAEASRRRGVAGWVRGLLGPGRRQG